MSKGTSYIFLDAGIQSPCFGCTVETGRSPVCHGTCEKYKKFKEAYREKSSKLYLKRKMAFMRTRKKYKSEKEND